MEAGVGLKEKEKNLEKEPWGLKPRLLGSRHQPVSAVSVEAGDEARSVSVKIANWIRWRLQNSMTATGVNKYSQRDF